MRRQARGVLGLVIGLAVMAATIANAAEAPVGLGTADSFAVLAGTTVTNTGPSIITGDLGVSPGTAITGFPPGVTLGAEHSADTEAVQAQLDLGTAYDDAAGRAPTTVYTGATPELGGTTLTSGVYKSATSLGITGTLTLNAQGDPNAVFIFQAGSTVITATNSSVALINGAQACNVFWQVGSSATIEVDSTFVGTVLALTSISAKTRAVVQGRLLARNGAVTLDSNVVTRPQCAAATTTTEVPPTTTTTVPPTTTTTVPPTTTTTVPPTTTTTVPPTTTTTAPPTTTTTAPPTTTTTAPPTTTTTAPPTTTTTRLPSPTTTSSIVVLPLPSTTTTRPVTTTTRPSTTTTRPVTTTTSSTSTTLPSTTTTSGGETSVSAVAVVEAQTLARTGSPMRTVAFAGGFALALGSLFALLSDRGSRRQSA